MQLAPEGLRYFVVGAYGTVCVDAMHQTIIAAAHAPKLLAQPLFWIGLILVCYLAFASVTVYKRQQEYKIIHVALDVVQIAIILAFFEFAFEFKQGVPNPRIIYSAVIVILIIDAIWSHFFDNLTEGRIVTVCLLVIPFSLLALTQHDGKAYGNWFGAVWFAVVLVFYIQHVIVGRPHPVGFLVAFAIVIAAATSISVMLQPS